MGEDCSSGHRNVVFKAELFGKEREVYVTLLAQVGLQIFVGVVLKLVMLKKSCFVVRSKRQANRKNALMLHLCGLSGGKIDQ